jgi:2-keto-3-deoxy-L-rhamnonate aldolase RhmA
LKIQTETLPGKGEKMRPFYLKVAACLAIASGVLLQAAQGPAPAAGQRGAGGAGGGRGAGGGAPANAAAIAAATPNPGNGGLIGGSTLPDKPDSRGWGWQVKALMSPATPRPLYNKAKELLLQDKTVTSYTISSLDPELYCEVRKHFDFVWFEMQHSTMSWDDIRRMIIACPGADGAAPFIRMPDELEANMQKATDSGAVGIVMPTVNDAIQARDAARFARYPPTGRRSSGGGSYTQAWPGINYRATINDNMLVVVMIETLEGVDNADEIAATFGVDAIILGNNDLSSFSGWAQNDPRYQDAIIKVHNAALRNGKFYGNAGSQYLNGYTVTADTKIVQNGPARDGWTPPRGGGGARGAAPAAGRGRGNAPASEEEPVIGLPAAPRGRGNQ